MIIQFVKTVETLDNLEEEFFLEKYTKYVVDTNILMHLEDLKSLVEYCEGLVTVPIYVVEELDNLKTKDAERGFQARRALRNMELYKSSIDFCIPSNELSWFLPSSWRVDKVDNMLVNYALNLIFNGENTVLLSNDLNVRIKCDSMKVPTAPYHEVSSISDGWTEITMTDQEYTNFCKEDKSNKWNVPFNQYLIIKDSIYKTLVKGIYKYFGDEEWIKVGLESLGNFYLGTTVPKDAYQQCVVNSLLEDNFTVITGKAGSGKTLLSVAYCLRQIQSGARDKLIIFANPVKTRGAEALGFYPGDRTEKLMQNSIGAMLSSKLGDKTGVDMLLESGKLEILPVSDIRGYEVSKNQIMYITEAQNLSIDLLKLAVQRCAEGAKIILEGDPCTQADHYSFEGANNGLRRVIDVFEGYYGFSHMNLPNIYRSEIANKADEL